MKPTLLLTSAGIVLTFGIAACVPQVAQSVEQAAQPPPVAAPSPTPVATPAPAPTPNSSPVAIQPSDDNWLDAPQTPGDWRYVDEPAESLALFGTAATHEATRFVIRCDKNNRGIGLALHSSVSVSANSSKVMRIRTETAERTFALAPVPDQPGLLAVGLPAAEPFLDAIALSKGRFAVETEGEPALFLPAWPEITRVIEDCR